MNRPASRPPRRSERIEKQIARSNLARQLLKEQLEIERGRLQDKLDELADSKWRLDQNEKERTDTQDKMNPLAAVMQKTVDRDQQIVIGLSSWLLSATLGANLAGLWALLGDKTTNANPLFWAMIWFSLGVLTSFAAGAFRLGVSSKNWTAMIRALSRAAVHEERVGKPNYAEGGAITFGIVASSALPIGLFVLGAIVIITARLMP